MPKLNDDDINKSLEMLPGWRRERDALTKTFELSAFVRAIALVNEVAELAEEMDHHPDMLIEYRKVTFTLSTHDAGGITEKDVALARAIEGLAKDPA